MKKIDRLYHLAKRSRGVTAFWRDVKAEDLGRTLAGEFLKLVASHAAPVGQSNDDRHDGSFESFDSILMSGPDGKVHEYPASHVSNGSQNTFDGRQTNGASQGSAASQSASVRPEGPSDAIKEGARLVALKVADTFMITERQGSRTALGDIPVRSYGRLIRALGKRTWVSSREYNTICILKGRADAQASIPQDAKTRDVFSDAELKNAITLAQALATPQIERNPEIIDA